MPNDKVIKKFLADARLYLELARRPPQPKCSNFQEFGRQPPGSNGSTVSIPA
jgi:hypothetical protein